MKTSKRSLTRAAAVLGITAAAALASFAPAGAAPTKSTGLYVTGVGTYTTTAAGDAVVTAPAGVYLRSSADAIPATMTATLSPVDGTLPEPETCEPANATIVVEGGRKASMTLVGTGNVCGKYPQQPTSVVTQVFTGRYDVVDADVRRLVGTDGFFEIRLGLGGIGSAFAVDT